MSYVGGHGGFEDGGYDDYLAMIREANRVVLTHPGDEAERRDAVQLVAKLRFRLIDRSQDAKSHRCLLPLVEEFLNRYGDHQSLSGPA